MTVVSAPSHTCLLAGAVLVMAVLQVLYVQAAVMVWVTTTLVKNIFFGTLRAAEVEVHNCAENVFDV